MGSRKIILKQSAADSISQIAWFIESKGLKNTAEKFADDVYDFIEKLKDERKSFAVCKEPVRAALGYKSIPCKKKYTIFFIESDKEIIICEFISSKLLHW
jgi:plasmid stabilization system protein ParE